MTLAPKAREEHYTTLAHELGHSFGLGELYPQAPPYVHEVSGWDLMGDVVYATSFLGWHRHKFQWLNADRKAYVTSPGSFVFDLAPLAHGAGLSMIVIPDPVRNAPAAPSKVWVIEVSGDVVSRADFLAKNGKKLAKLGDGVLIYTVETPPQSGKREIRIMPRATPVTNLHADVLFHAPPLGGDQFNDARAPFGMKIKSRSGDIYTIQVDVK